MCFCFRTKMEACFCSWTKIDTVKFCVHLFKTCVPHHNFISESTNNFDFGLVCGKGCPDCDMWWPCIGAWGFGLKVSAGPEGKVQDWGPLYLAEVLYLARRPTGYFCTKTEGPLLAPAELYCLFYSCIWISVLDRLACQLTRFKFFQLKWIYK